MTGDSRPAKVPVIEVCHGPECSDRGGRELTEELVALGLKTMVGDCRSQCPNAPLVLVDNRMITQATCEKVEKLVRAFHANAASD